MLGLFTKHPGWMPVKTRLASSLGAAAAGAAATAMLEFLLEQLSGCATRRQIVCWPPESAGDFRREWGHSWEVIPQIAGDLGQKQHHWFLHSGPSPGRASIAIGGDCPLVTPEIIASAIERLESGPDMLLGPACDGGYWLLGLRKPPGRLFGEIEWSSSRAAEQLLDNARREGLEFLLGETLPDIDTVDDLRGTVLRLSRSDEPARLALAGRLERTLKGACQ